MKNSDLNKIFSQFDNFNILIIGDVMIDRYLWGKVDRISPEAPVPIVSCSLQEDRLGGAANVALNIKAMGATPFLCGITGTDKESFLFIELMDSEKLNTEGILSSENRKTTSKTRIISKNQQLLRIDKENDESVSEYIEKEFLHMVFSLMNKHNIHALIFEDYDKGTLTENIIEQIVKKAKEINIPVLVDPKKRNFLSYKNVTLFKPNIKELKEGLKIELNKNDIHELQKTTNILKEKLNSEKTLITLSESGIFISDGKSNKHFAAEFRDIIDVSGAGDTVIAVASLCLVSGVNDSDLAAISNIAGGLACEKVGVVPVSREELLDECLKKPELFK